MKQFRIEKERRDGDWTERTSDYVTGESAAQALEQWLLDEWGDDEYPPDGWDDEPNIRELAGVREPTLTEIAEWYVNATSDTYLSWWDGDSDIVSLKGVFEDKSAPCGVCHGSGRIDCGCEIRLIDGAWYIDISLCSGGHTA